MGSGNASTAEEVSGKTVASAETPEASAILISERGPDSARTLASETAAAIGKLASETIGEIFTEIPVVLEVVTAVEAESIEEGAAEVYRGTMQVFTGRVQVEQVHRQ